MLAVSLVAVLAATGVLTAAFQFGLPWWMGDRDSNHSFTNDHGLDRRGPCGVAPAGTADVRPTAIIDVARNAPGHPNMIGNRAGRAGSSRP